MFWFRLFVELSVVLAACCAAGWYLSPLFLPEPDWDEMDGDPSGKFISPFPRFGGGNSHQRRLARRQQARAAKLGRS